MADGAPKSATAIKARGVQPFGPFERMLSLRYLRAKREHGGLALISIVSTIGVTLAVFALITIMSIMNGFRLELLSKIVGFEPHVYVEVSGMPEPEARRLMQDLTMQPGVEAVEPLIDDQVLATANGRQEGVAVRGVRPDDLQRNELIREGVLQGELDRFGVDGVKSNDVIVGAGLARALGLSLGSPLKLISPEGASTAFGVAPRSKTYTVSAIFNVGNEKYDRYLIFMPIGQAGLFFNEREGYRTIGVRLSDPDDAGEFATRLRREQITDRFAYDWQRLNAQFVTALIVERNVMRIIMMIVVMITALNIITGVLMLVKNKARDIAILRTIGATRGGVVRIFLMTGSILGAVGVLTGLVLGVAFVMNIGPIQHFIEGLLGVELFPKSIYMLDAIPAQLQWSEVAIVTGWAFLMTVLTTLIPSMWASRLDPVEALRNQ